MIAKKEPIKCLSCGAAVKGRADKKFCNDYCRNEYNNGLKSNTTNLVRNINNALSKNRRILESLISEGQETAKANGEKLLAKGFQFKYGTHSYTNKKGDIYFFCYDMGYLPLENDWYLIVKRKEE
jgi:predicted nucleic acid-binding Zn ribbon protein